MPGKIFKVVSKSGMKVQQGETLLILEAMKMEHSIKSPYDGIVKKIFYREGEQVDAGATLVLVEQEAK